LSFLSTHSLIFGRLKHNKYNNIYMIIKFLRYNTRSDWSKVCNMSVYIRGQRFSGSTCTCHCFKIFYKSNTKRLLVCIYCDINTLIVVEQPRSHRNTLLHIM
jgi:hypothetical protein